MNLFRFRAPVLFPQNHAIGFAAEAHARVNAARRADSYALRRYIMRSRHPDSAGAVIQFVDPVAQHTITVGYRADNSDVFVLILRWVGVDLRNCGLARAR